MAVLRISFLAICLAVVATAENRKQQHWSLFSSFSGDEPKPEVAKDKAEEQSEDKAETKTEVQSEDKQDGKDYNKIAPFGKEDTAKELQDQASKTQNTLVDAVENAEATRTPCSAQPSKKQQLKGTILESMCESLGNANFLVFGTGFDSQFWVKSNAGGSTRFLESHESWVSFQPQEVKDVVTVVNYTTKFEEAMAHVSDEHLLKEFYDKQVPKDVKSTRWNQILVDGPEGFKGGPGRGQSIYAAMKLAGPDTVIFVDDCGRQVEQGYIKKYLQDGRRMEEFSNGHGGRTCKLTKPGDGWLQKTWKSLLR